MPPYVLLRSRLQVKPTQPSLTGAESGAPTGGRGRHKARQQGLSGISQHADNLRDVRASETHGGGCAAAE